MSTRRQRLNQARLYLICDRPSRPFLDAALSGGADIVQLRMKDAPDAEILATAEVVAAACADHGALFILNDRPDLVEATGADGVHVGQEDAPVAVARGAVGSKRLVGLSTHTPEQIEAAAGAGADYIGVGPVYETPTKPGRPAVGLELVRFAAAHARVPFFAIGAIDTGNVAAVARAGARRAAVVRALTLAEDPAWAASELRARLEREEAVVGSAQP
jgi:thiamine-phosphate pyrophosphorylase